jgi:hypothetical protein
MPCQMPPPTEPSRSSETGHQTGHQTGQPTGPTPPVPAPTAGATPARRSVHFSQGGIRSGGASASPAAALIPVFLLGGAALAFAGYLSLGRFPWLPLAVRATLVSALFLVVMTLLFRAAAHGYRRVMTALRMPMEMDPGADLNVICWPDQMAALEPLLPPPGDAGAFEPEAVRVWRAKRTSLAARLQTKRQQVRFGIMTSAFVVLIQLGVHLGVRGYIDFTPVLGVVGVALLVPVAWGFVRPMFLRIAPGRVDVVRFGWFGARPTIETHSLRGRPVRLDMRRKELLIGGWDERQPDAERPETRDGPPESPDGVPDGPPDGPSEPDRTGMDLSNQATKDPQAVLGTPHQIRNLTIIPYWASADIGTIERSLFRAAVSTATPAPLPDDELIG